MSIRSPMAVGNTRSRVDQPPSSCQAGKRGTAVLRLSKPSKVLFLLVFLLPGGIFAQEYANPKVCAGCHPAIAKTYGQNGMGRSFSVPKPEILIEDFTKKNTYYHAPSDTHYQMLREGDRITQRRYQIGFDGKETNIDEKEVDYIVGSGNHMRTYTHRNADGTLLQLPLAWYAEKGGYWAMNPGFDTPDYPYAMRRIAYDCMFCHNAYPKIPAGHGRMGDTPVYTANLPDGIDCQRCHGPGQRHANIAATPGAKPEAIRSAIVNPARLSGNLQLDVCAQCHLKTTEFLLPHAIKRYDRADFSYKPGEPLSSFALAFDEAHDPAKKGRFETASAVTRMRESQCYLQSKGALTCTTCHNPHDIRHGAEAAAQYNGVCRQCHAQAFTQAVASGKHTANTGCIDCHMPKRRTEDIVHMVMTDHLIQRIRPAGDLLADRPEYHENPTSAYHGEVVPYFPDLLPKTPADALYLALAQVRDGANLKKGIPQLEKAIAAANSVRPEPYFELATAWRTAGQLPRAIETYKVALRHDPAYLPALLDLSQALTAVGKPAQAFAVLKHATDVAPADARAWNALGQLMLNGGQPAAAIGPLKKAVGLDPELPTAHNGVGISLAQTNDLAGAEAEFREAIRILPNYGEPHGNLANLLAWKQDLAQASYEFDLAVRLQPGDAAARLNYGVMLNGMRRFDEAQAQLEAAVQLSPKIAEAHDLLGTLLERKGLIDRALEQYQQAVRLKPGLSHAQLDLGGVLMNRGDKTGAEQHLRLAARSDDPGLRQIAEKLLGELASN